MRRSRLLPGLLLTLIGCGKASDAPPSSGAWPSFDAPKASSHAVATPLPRACALVTGDQASTLLALPAENMADEPEDCLWAGSSGVGNVTMLLVQISDSNDLALAQDVFTSLAGMAGNLSGLVNSQTGDRSKKYGREIEDLGDEAWLSAASFGQSFGPHQLATQMLTVRKGTRILSINVSNTSKAEGLGQRMETVARVAIDQL